MHPKIKVRRAGAIGALSSVRPPMPHDLRSSAFAGDPKRSAHSASVIANHARHHVARKAQA
jgi:hypothetical protein